MKRIDIDQMNDDVVVLYENTLDRTRGIAYFSDLSPIDRGQTGANRKEPTWEIDSPILPYISFNDSIALNASENFILVGERNRVRAIRAHNGTSINNSLVMNSEYNYIALLSNGNPVIFNEGISFYDNDLNLITENNLSSEDSAESISISENDAIYVSSRDRILKINPSLNDMSVEQRILWEYDNEFAGSINEVATDSHDNVYYGTSVGKIIKLNSNGQLIWESEIAPDIDRRGVSGLAIYEP